MTKASFFDAVNAYADGLTDEAPCCPDCGEQVTLHENALGQVWAICPCLEVSE